MRSSGESTGSSRDGEAAHSKPTGDDGGDTAQEDPDGEQGRLAAELAERPGRAFGADQGEARRAGSQLARDGVAGRHDHEEWSEGHRHPPVEQRERRNRDQRSPEIPITDELGEHASQLGALHHRGGEAPRSIGSGDEQLLGQLGLDRLQDLGEDPRRSDGSRHVEQEEDQYLPRAQRFAEVELSDDPRVAEHSHRARSIAACAAGSSRSRST